MCDVVPTSAPPLRPYTKIHSPPRSKGTVVGRLGNRLSSAVRAGVDGYEIFQSNPIKVIYRSLAGFSRSEKERRLDRYTEYSPHCQMLVMHYDL